jgi:hypothetical protein
MDDIPTMIAKFPTIDVTVLVFVLVRHTDPRLGRGCADFGQLEDGCFATSTELSRRRHGVQGAGDDLCGAGTAGFVRGFGFQQFGMRQDDPELVVQPVEHLAQIKLRLWNRRQWIGHAWCEGHAGEPGVPLVAATALATLPWASTVVAGERQRESAKMRMDPPAVRTYSTFPAEIQL